MAIDNLNKSTPTTQQAMMNGESSTLPVHTPTTEQNIPNLVRPPLDNLDTGEEQQPLLMSGKLTSTLPRPPSPNITPTSRTPATTPPSLSVPPPGPTLAAKTLDCTAKILKGALIVTMGAAVGAVIGTTLIPAIGTTLGLTVGAMAAPAIGAGLVASLLVLPPAINEVKYLANQSLFDLSCLAISISVGMLSSYLILHPMLSFSLWPASLAVALGISGVYLGNFLTRRCLDIYKECCLRIYLNDPKYLQNIQQHQHINRFKNKLLVLGDPIAYSSAACLIGFTLTSGVAFSSLPLLISIPTILAFGSTTMRILAGVAIILSTPTLHLFSQVAAKFSSSQPLPAAA